MANTFFSSERNGFLFSISQERNGVVARIYYFYRLGEVNIYAEIIIMYSNCLDVFWQRL